MKKALALFLTGMIAASALWSSGNGESAASGAYSEISYRFIDSSVPPQYHRSYTITLTAKTVSIVIDSYGDIVAEKVYPGSPSLLREAADQLKKCRIRSGIKRISVGGCTGGTGESVGWISTDGRNFKASVYHCGGKDEGALYGDIETFSDWCKARIPDLGTLLDTPYDPESRMSDDQ